jgi:hypothetical protein
LSFIGILQVADVLFRQHLHESSSWLYLLKQTRACQQIERNQLYVLEREVITGNYDFADNQQNLAIHRSYRKKIRTKLPSVLFLSSLSCLFSQFEWQWSLHRVPLSLI